MRVEESGRLFAAGASPMSRGEPVTVAVRRLVCGRFAGRRQKSETVGANGRAGKRSRSTGLAGDNDCPG